MRDEKGYDEKILTVPAHDPRFEEIGDISHLPDHLLTEVQYFFEVYKDLEGKETALLGWHPKKVAYERIRQAIDHYAGLRSI
jgi:inorganic pyrophosphatase